MVYLDTSVALAEVLTEPVVPPTALWEEELISSRLLEYEAVTRLDRLGLIESHGDTARALIRKVSLIELVTPLVDRARHPGMRLRTLDALHLASMLWLRDQGVEVRLASYDPRLNEAAERQGIPLYPL